MPSSLPYQVYVVPIFGGGGGITFSPQYTFIANDIRADASALAAHEFFHASQWMYQRACPQINELQITWAWWGNEDLRWWMEATADWAQREAVTTDRSYIDPIRTYLGRPWQHMDTRPPQGGDNFAYSPLFPFYLIERIAGGSKGIIRTIWEEYRDHGNCGALKPVLQRVLGAQNPPTTLEQLFPNYAEVNYFLAYGNENEFRRAPRPHGLGDAFRPVHREEPLNEQISTVSGPPSTFGGRTIEQLGAAYVEFRDDFTVKNLGRALKIRVNFSVFSPSQSVSPVVKIWTITQAAPPQSSATIIPPVRLVSRSGLSSGYVAQVTIPNFDSYQWVAVEVVDPQTTESRLDWSYQADVLAPTPTPTHTRTPTATWTPTRTVTPALTPTPSPTP